MGEKDATKSTNVTGASSTASRWTASSAVTVTDEDDVS